MRLQILKFLTMAIKGKVIGPPKSIAHKDHYARISYLYQASNVFAQKPKFHVLSRNFSRLVDLVAKKTVLKLTPDLKRTCCKNCNTLLIPGLSVSIYVENASKSGDEKNDVLVHKCLECDACKRFPIGRDRSYELFSERAKV